MSTAPTTSSPLDKDSSPWNMCTRGYPGVVLNVFNCQPNPNPYFVPAGSPIKVSCPGDGCGRKFYEDTLIKYGGTCHNCHSKRKARERAKETNTITSCPGCDTLIRKRVLKKRGGYCGRCINDRKGIEALLSIAQNSVPRSITENK